MRTGFKLSDPRGFSHFLCKSTALAPSFYLGEGLGVEGGEGGYIGIKTTLKSYVTQCFVLLPRSIGTTTRVTCFEYPSCQTRLTLIE